MGKYFAKYLEFLRQNIKLSVFFRRNLPKLFFCLSHHVVPAQQFKDTIVHSGILRFVALSLDLFTIFCPVAFCIKCSVNYFPQCFQGCPTRHSLFFPRNEKSGFCNPAHTHQGAALLAADTVRGLALVAQAPTARAKASRPRASALTHNPNS